METKQILLSDADLKFSAGDTGEFSGYASVFNVLDSKNDIILPGAYDNVLKSANNLPIYVNHGWIRGELPIGTWGALKSDGHGLSGTAQIELRMSTGADAYWAIKSTLINGLSVAIMPDKNNIEIRSDGVRMIHNITALKEISIVDQPANDKTRITDVKFSEELETVQTVRDFERFLRDAGMFTKSEAMTIISRAKAVFATGEPEKKPLDFTQVMAKIANINSKLGN